MILFPHAKINIGLNVVKKRNDGFHNLETIFYPITLSDVLEFIESPDGEMKFENSGIEIGDNDNNLCLKAYAMLKRRFDIPPLHIHLNKIIPIGAGLGGGSSDGAFMLKGLNDYFNLGLSNDEMAWMAVDMGSDCPFFIFGKPLYAEGKGDEFSDTALSLNGKHIVLVYPNIFVPTKDAYSGVLPKPSEIPLAQQVLSEVNTWDGKIVNDFEKSVFEKYPSIKKVKELLYKQGALYASMSGSGSSVFGVFDEKIDLHVFDEQHFIWDGVL